MNNDEKVASGFAFAPVAVGGGAASAGVHPCVIVSGLNWKTMMRKIRADRSTLFKKLALDECVVRTDRSFVEPLRQLFARRAKRMRSR